MAATRTWTNVLVEVIAKGKGVVVRPKGTGDATTGGPLPPMPVQIPKALRTPGAQYRIDRVEMITTSSGGKFLTAGKHAGIGRGIRISTLAPASPQISINMTPSAFAQAASQAPGGWALHPKAQANAASWDAALPTPSRRVLEPDQIIDGGRDVTVNPSSTARSVYGGVARGEGRDNRAVFEQARRHAEALEEWPAFVREVFARLYDEQGCRPLADEERSTWGTSALAALEQQTEWPTLREAAQVSRQIAATACAQMAAAVSTAMQLDKVKTDEETRRDPREVHDEGESIERLMTTAGASPEEIKAAHDENAERAAAAMAVRRAIDKQLEVGRPALAQAVRAAATQAKEKAALVEAFAGLGFSREGPGSIESECPELLNEVKFDPRMLAIIRMAGRMKDAAQGDEAKGDGRCDVVGVVPTGDVTKLTPRTKADLAGGGLRGLATMRDIVEGGAQGWEQRDQAPRNSGDVGLVVDRSGSMSGEPEIRARALNVAALVSCLQSGRRVIACSFSGRGDAPTAAAVPGDLRSLGEAVRVLCRRAGGGTDVDFALGAVLEAMKRFPGGLRSPDIVLSTDGIFPPVPKRILDGLGDRRLFGVLIGMPDDGTHKEFDQLFPIGSGAISDDDAARIINSLRRGRGKKRSAA